MGTCDESLPQAKKKKNIVQQLIKLILVNWLKVASRSLHNKGTLYTLPLVSNTAILLPEPEVHTACGLKENLGDRGWGRKHNQP
jgi:hypothetical protein